MVAESDEETRTANEPVEDPALPQPPPQRLAAPLQVRDPDRYDVLGEHGRGGLGKVTRAHDKELGRNVAIKELLKRGDVGEVRFLREALVTARLEHPGIVPIHEAGRWPDGTPFYVMKLVAGRSLKELLAERKTVEERIQLLPHVVAVADAVAYAHKRKIIHRDLKPANVIVGDFGETVVIDWGLAKDLSQPDEPVLEPGPYRVAALTDLTETGAVLGTPTYMPPEQWRGEAVDQRADVFAIGAMLWEVCSILKVPPTDPRHRDRLLRRAGIDRDLGAILAKALSPEPEHRYRDAAELATDLKAFTSGARIASRQYSLLGVIRHWMRRHRAFTAAIAFVAVFALTGSLLYVRNIAIARDRADAAAIQAEAQRATASIERDNARLAQAAALLDKDPTRARDVLEKLTIRPPQYALLVSRANFGAASHVFRVPLGFAHLLRHPLTSEIAFVSNAQELTVVDVDRNELRVLDRDLQNAVTSSAEGWVYSRKMFDAATATVVRTVAPRQTINVGNLLIEGGSSLLTAGGRTYAIDRSDLYTIEGSGPVLIRRGVRSIAGSDRILMLCMSAGQLEIVRDGIVEQKTRCAKNLSNRPMAVAGTNYSALLDANALLLVRDGQPLKLSTYITGEYELALADSGLLGMADFDGKPWFVRPGGDRLELGPAHAARVLSVAVDGQIAAWGFDDGVVIAFNTMTGQTWKLVGHASAVGKIVIDESRGRLVSAGGDELRVWPLPSSPIKSTIPMPCIVFNAARSSDGKRVALDCNDGIVREWSLATDALRVLHRHEAIAFGVAWVGDAACSASLDASVLCTNNRETRELRAHASRVRLLVNNPHNNRLLIAAEDGEVGEIGGATLYKHSSIPYSMALTPDGQRLATGAADGSVIIYDMLERRIRSSTITHGGLVTSVAWYNGELWTTGADGAIKRWKDVVGTMSAIGAFSEQGSARFLHLFSGGWSATIGGRALVIKRGSRKMRLDFDRHVVGSDISWDERYIATATTSEIVIVDLTRNAVAMLPVPSRGGYVGFVKPGSLTISNASGLVNVPLASLQYIDYEPDGR